MNSHDLSDSFPSHSQHESAGVNSNYYPSKHELSDTDSALGASERMSHANDDDIVPNTNDIINTGRTKGNDNVDHVTTEQILESAFSSIVRKSTAMISSLALKITNPFEYGPIYPSIENISYYKHLLDVASTFEQFHAAAHQLDRLENNENWKEDSFSTTYDYKLIMNRLVQLRKARESGDVGSMIFLLRTSLSRNIGDIGNSALYCKTRVGTKKAIEDYIDEVVRQLNLICMAPEYSIDGQVVLSLDEKLEFFLNTRQSFGRTALLLSGGATLGLNHIGVIKALQECKLLPRIISGSSVGSLIAALVCSKTDNELFDYLHKEELNLNALEAIDEEGSLFFKISRFIKHGVIFDVEVLKECIRSNIGDVTFLDAYNRTRRILNITVSSSTKYEMPRLLNYLTAPNVLIWSAVAASCAIPFVYKSAPLMARDKYGKIVPWNPSGHRWIDGSVENDLPMMRLSEMFNVNHFIVSQVNPHVVPFLSKMPQEKATGIIASASFLLQSELNHRLSQLIDLEVFPTTLHRIQNIISQRYYGDITIVPNVKLQDYMQLITNPSKETLWDAVIRGEKATWPQISIIKNHCSVELALDDIIYRLRCRKLDVNLSFMQHSGNGVVDPQSKYSTLQHGAISPGVLSRNQSNDQSRNQSETQFESDQPEFQPLSRSRSVGRGMNYQKLVSASMQLGPQENAVDISKGYEKKNAAACSEWEFTAGSEAVTSSFVRSELPLTAYQSSALIMTAKSPDAEKKKGTSNSNPSIQF